jgi:hypothetical protein
MTPILGIIASSFRSAAGPDGAYDSLATITVPSGGLASVTFAGIPNNYKHLEIRWIGKDNRAATSDSVNMVFNGDTTTGNYYGHRLYGDGSGAVSQNFGGFGTGWINGTSTGSIFGASISTILDYASTTKNKTVRTLGGNDINGGGEVGLYSMLWMNSTTAINSIRLSPANGSSFNEYSQFALYGVK